MSQHESFLEGKRILVVEDREENRRLMRAILKLEGAEVLEAASASEGMEIAVKELPDLILMDFHMPHLDGLSATRMLRENPQTRPIAIVFVTASAGEATRRAALEAGGDGFLTKPIDPSCLASQIGEILEARKKDA